MSYSTLTDNELWKCFLSGDKKALAYIYSKQYQSLLAYGMKLFPDYELVRDCIQDMFVKLYINRKNISLITHINSYLIKALRNRIYDEVSVNIKKTEIGVSSFDFITDDFFLTFFPENDDDLAQRKKLKNAIEKLTARQREIIYLRFIRELDYNEIGDLLGINYQSAKNLVSRSLVKLRSFYTEE
ncbi:MAG: sigma-70 family RNA polymerase sigma factor [Massilibacteroides sp.]|nr:sigma-70 family RNA polymerase sigma factor [Massilibacteroides sp.]MDD3063575.1 sigma-70 family RNA polymerase sigma factor [Massilibacteroides sp.]MDD4114248.1 sigma-70 family RNA polymerase sigma factor [Massilibacteroides sp.]MDD4661000.1 sigma-70 family RNA polymerase sigma factor [Massilibacteroides sp.]